MASIQPPKQARAFFVDTDLDKEGIKLFCRSCRNHLTTVIFLDNPEVVDRNTILDLKSQCPKCRYINIFYNFVLSSASALCACLQTVDAWCQQNAIDPTAAKPQGLKAAVQRIEKTGIYEAQYVNDPVPSPQHVPATEAEKPAGTRDPDKFLKEQQNKQLKELFG